ncbi:flagellar hook-length control protein FliK [Limnohabitans sp. Hippo4]|uniref:flagellar hook-length control protein FliK n=1 Tax=Limnohabitans sp. Hippo4 TaxID=1826167 RepID=UPI000D334E04|nr:flagellar hook-length control protein FliK [Limnohabitans sp. Hippo4]PUE37906.1 hypothetical protein B9Z46_04300 [Limnohabitans sp. Hippo4]
MAIIVTNPSTVQFSGTVTDAQDPAANPIDTGFTEELANAMQPVTSVAEGGQSGPQIDADPADEKLLDLQILPADVLLNAVGDANFALASQGLKAETTEQIPLDQTADLKLADPNLAADMAAAALAAQMAGAALPVAVTSQQVASNTATDLAVDAVAQAGGLAANASLQSNAADTGAVPQAFIDATGADKAANPVLTSDVHSTQTAANSDLSQALSQVREDLGTSVQTNAVSTLSLDGRAQSDAQPVTTTAIQQMAKAEVTVPGPEAAALVSVPNNSSPTATQAVAVLASQAQPAAATSNEADSTNIHAVDASLTNVTAQISDGAMVSSEITAEAITSQSLNPNAPVQSTLAQAPVSTLVNVQLTGAEVAQKSQPVAVTAKLQTVEDAANLATDNLDVADTDKPNVVQKSASSVEESALKFDAKLGGDQEGDAGSIKLNAAQQAIDLQAQSVEMSRANSDIAPSATKSFEEVSSTFVSSLVGGAQRPVTTVMDWVALKNQEVPRPVMPHEVRLDAGAVQVEIQRMVKQGGGHVVMELTPPDQSKFTIELKLDDKGGAYLRVEGVSDSTKTRLEQSAPQLQEQFQQMGLNLQLDMRQNQQSSSQVFDGSSNDAGFDNQLPETLVDSARPQNAGRSRPNNGNQIYLYA